MNAGRNYLDQGDATNALAVYRKAQAIVPNSVDVHLNLANANLLAGAEEEAVREAEEALRLDPTCAAAHFIKGSAWLRLSKPEEAVKAFENARKIEAGEVATMFQLGRARMELGQWEDAIAAFREGIAMDPNHIHSGAHYLLARALLRAGRQDEAQQELQHHLAGAQPGDSQPSLATFERCKYTQARVPFRLDQPQRQGVMVKYVDVTGDVFGGGASGFSGPVGVIDLNHNGWNSLFAFEKNSGFRMLWNDNGKFNPRGQTYPAKPGAHYTRMLVGDLDNDRVEDIVVLGSDGSHLFRFDTNGVATDVSSRSGLSQLCARDGLLIDLDFTGKLDLMAVTAATNHVRLFRQFGPLLFKDITGTSGIPDSLRDARAVLMEDWTRDEIMDVIVERAGGASVLFEKVRGGQLRMIEQTNWAAGSVICTGDFDNDLRPDLAVWNGGTISICYNGGARRTIPVTGEAGFQQLVAVDYDNDGWLDLWGAGARVRAWRNLGLSGFEEQTAQLGLDKLEGGQVAALHFADFDMDCDSDVVVELASGGLRYLRNDGGNSNLQVKVRLVGNRSNASGLGCKVEIEAGGLRLLRTVRQLPVEIGVGKHPVLDSFLVHWLNWPQGSAELPFDCKQPILALELTVQEGSCPYLYAWNGNGFRFVTDILGGSPLGLPVGEGRYTDADPEEYVWIGDEEMFPPVDEMFVLQITEELREVLYLDEAKLVVVDREPGTEVHPTDKLLPCGPFPPGTLLTVHNEHPLVSAYTLANEDVTETLKAVDGRRVSPPKLRVPQLRGLAEPHGIVLDFGALDVAKPLVLVMNGWIRFGGGMANIAASHDSSLPFPFPTLEAEVSPGTWKKVDVTVGAPCGKTKTILVDLEGKLEHGTRRLRLTQAFEIHWDRIAMMEKKSDARTRITFVSPIEADLHFRGFSKLKDLPWDWPLTPAYQKVSADPCWTVIPGGWCTRYGNVIELITARDEALAIINAGDELTLRFAADSLPPKQAGQVREFFLYADGWDKDSDFHVAEGAQVEPLPFHGMDDQAYGRQQRPAFTGDELHKKYNTRWVESKPPKVRPLMGSVQPQ
ncbi:MAG: tetratricopeptide repeat protein [Verrucomicrobia bacterium]|nr:tetratricopeptide repeat protein [Verrucomicrobiota bacterium]